MFTYHIGTARSTFTVTTDKPERDLPKAIADNRWAVDSSGFIAYLHGVAVWHFGKDYAVQL